MIQFTGSSTRAGILKCMMKIVCFSIEFSTFCQSNPFWLWCLGVALPHCRRRLLLYYTRLLPALGRLLPAFGSVLCCCELKGWYENDIRYNPSCKICSSDLLSDSVESGCTWLASVLHGPINCIVKMYHKLYQPYQYCYVGWILLRTNTMIMLIRSKSPGQLVL